MNDCASGVFVMTIIPFVVNIMGIIITMDRLYTTINKHTHKNNSFQQMSVCSIDRPLRSRSAGKDPSWT